VLATACILSSGIGGAASAQPPVPADGAQVVVRYPDLDLYRSAGAKALIARLGQAADAACGPKVSSTLAINDARLRKACVDQNMNAMFDRVDRQALAAAISGAGPLQQAQR
jgi:UrcA family protein